MATENLIEFGGDSQGNSDSEARGVAQEAPEESSDIERRRSVIIVDPTWGPSSSTRGSEWLEMEGSEKQVATPGGVIIGAAAWGPSSSIRDSEQLLSLKSVGEVPEEGASVRSPERAGSEVEVQIPEGELENLDDVRTRLDGILGVLSGGGRSSTRGGSGSERHRRDPSIGGRSPEKLTEQFSEAVHTGATGGHLGLWRTMDEVRRRGFWFGWRRSVKQYCHGTSDSVRGAVASASITRGDH